MNKLSSEQSLVLDILLDSSTGLTETELTAKAKLAGVSHPMKVFGQLVAEGLARKQSRKNEGRPDVFKAINLAFETKEG